MKEITINTHSRTEFVDISGVVQQTLKEIKAEDCFVIVYVPHTTAGITINENADPDVLHDLEKALDKMVPWSAGYEHSEGNSAAHVKASLVGSSVSVPVIGGRLKLGTWQSIFFCEFDGPRTRHVWVSK